MTTLPPTARSYPPVSPTLAARCPTLPGDASWTALLADTSSGLRGLARWKVKVLQQPERNSNSARLIVHAYRRADVVDGRPTEYSRPLASAQRSVRSDELREGVTVELVHFSEAQEDSVVVAWTEPDDTESDFEGLESRPKANCQFAETIALPVDPLRAKYITRSA